MLDELTEFLNKLYVMGILSEEELRIPVDINYIKERGFKVSWNGYSAIAPTTMLAFKKLKEYLETVEEFKIKEVD